MVNKAAVLLIVLSCCWRTGQTQTGTEWSPPRNAKVYQLGEPTTISTPGDGQYGYAWYTVQSRNQFVFSVRACNNAMLSLSRYIENKDDFSLEIVLGAENNDRSLIRYSYKQGSLFQTSTPHILHCNELRSFWLTWNADSFRVGRGSFVGEQELMFWREIGLQINCVGLSSDFGSSAVWEVLENSADYLVIDTPDEHKYEMMWKSVKDKHFWTFGVQAGGDVHVVLTEKLGVADNNIYEFVIGGWYNNRSVIRTQVLGGGDSIKAQLDERNIVSASETREFWISWFGGLIEFGRGAFFGKRRVLSYLDPRPRSIAYLSITTGFGNKGRWFLQDDQESTNYVFTTPTASLIPEDRYNKLWVSTPRQEFFTFSVTACQEAYVLLSNFIGIDPDVALEIVIGTEFNSKSLLRYVSATSSLVEVPTMNALSCTETRPFWISWNSGLIKFGVGYVYSQQTIFEKKVFDPSIDGFRVNALSIATPTAQGEWRIRESVGERIHLQTPDYFNHYDQMWRTVTQRQYITFRIRACSDCHVAMAPTPGVDFGETYLDFIIGGWDNTRSQVHRVKGPNMEHREDVGPSINTTGILNCDHHVDLWISWSESTIRYGRGVLPIYNMILEQPVDQLFAIKAVSFSTGFGYIGDYIVDEYVGDYFMYYTMFHDSVRWLQLNEAATWIYFKVRACKQVSIYLSETLSVNTVYEIVLGANDNQKSIFYDRGNQVVDAATPNMLECFDNRHVWLSWAADGRVQVGHGTLPGRNIFLTYDDRNPIKVRAIGYLGIAEDTNSRWQVLRSTAAYTQFMTADYMTYEQMWESVDHRNGITFGVACCSDVHIVVSHTMRWWTDVYDLVIGGWHNTRSAIYLYAVREYAHADTPDILHCTERRYFWVSWKYGVIEVGRGELIGREKFMEYQPLLFYPVTAVGYTTGYGFVGTWYIKADDALIPTEPPATQNPGVTEPVSGTSSGGLSPEAIGGIVLASLAAAMLVVGIGMYLYTARRDAQPAGSSGGSSSSAAIFRQASSDRQAIAPGNVAPEQAGGEL